MDYKVTDTELTSVADAIRTKGSTSALLEWPDGFAQAVIDLPSGGGGNYDNFKIAMGAMSGSIYDTETSVIGQWAFMRKTGLTGLEMTAVLSTSQSCCYSCSALTAVSLPNCTYVAQSAFFGCSMLTSVYIPKATSLSDQCFAGCYALTEASFPLCESILDSAFSNCKSLASVSFPELRSISQSAFAGCARLTEVSFPKCLSIGNGGFYYCINMLKATFPALTLIRQKAFLECSKLAELDILTSTVCSLSNSNAFNLTPMKASSYIGQFGSIYVPSSLVDTYKTAANWSYYSDRITAYIE